MKISKQLTSDLGKFIRRFAADMKVEILNDGPVTIVIILRTKNKPRGKRENEKKS
jgi:hypothetical protein